MLRPQGRRAAALSAALATIVTLSLLGGCSDDRAPTRGAQDARLAVTLRLRDAGDGGSGRAAGGRNVIFDYSDVIACATETGDGGVHVPDCTAHEFPRGDSHFRLELSVPVATYYVVDVDVTGERTENGKTSENGLLFYGQGYAYELSADVPESVVVVLDEVVPRPIIDRRGGTIAWPLVPGATQYRLLETPAQGAAREHLLSTNGANLGQLGITSASLRVRAELANARVSAYSESINVEVAPPRGVVSGSLIDANEQAVSCALVKLMGCGGDDTGLFTYTGADGRFVLPPAGFGQYFLSVYRPGCGDLLDPSQGCFTLEELNGVDRGLLTAQCEGSIWTTITLNWSANPPDLDAHLWVPAGVDSVYDVYFAQSGSVTTFPFATLDRDQTNGFGPEGISIHENLPGTYTFAVQHYCESSGTGTLSTSGAEVRICRADGTSQTITVPSSGAQEFWWWNVCTIDGRSGEVTVINTLTPDPPLPSGVCTGLTRTKLESAR